MTAFFSGNTTSPGQPESAPPAQTDAKAPEDTKGDARPFSVPPLLGAQEEVKQAEENKALEAKEAAVAAEAAAAAEQAKKDTEETVNSAKAKAAEETKQAAEAAKKAAAEANASAPLSTSVTAFTGEITGNSTMNSVVPLSLLTLSIRPAGPPVGQPVGHPKAYERKRSLLWNALSAGMSISPHHDMPVSRSLSLIEFVHTTQSHTVLLGVVPGLVLLFVCAALILEGVGMTGMLKG